VLTCCREPADYPEGVGRSRGRPDARGPYRGASRPAPPREDAPEHSRGTLRERLDLPIERATELTRRTLSWFPIRVWRRFLQRNGFLLAAGVSHQALFAIFAVIYVAFASVGLWAGTDHGVINALISIVDTYIPALIGEGGVISTEQVVEIARSGSALFSVTGVIALVALVWTAIGWVTFSRRAVRDIFGLPPDTRNYALLKARDFVAAVFFGAALLAGGVLSGAGTWFISALFDLLGWSTSSGWFHVLVGFASVLVGFAVDVLALAGLFRFLAGASIAWRRLLPGSVVGGIAMIVLQLGAGLLLSYSPSNPLLATFAVFIGLLLWCRLTGVVMLVAASWVAVAVADDGLPLAPAADAAQREADRTAALLDAVDRLRAAAEERRAAPWYGRRSARRAERRAIDELEELAIATATSGSASRRPSNIP